MTDKEKLDILEQFLLRINCGYMELSYLKVVGEYHYFYHKAGELRRQLFCEEPDPQAYEPLIDMDF